MTCWSTFITWERLKGLQRQAEAPLRRDFLHDIGSGVAGDHHVGGVGVDLVQLLEGFEAAHAGHTNIHEGEVEGALGGDLDGGGAILTGDYVMPKLSEDILQEEADALLIIHHQNIERVFLHDTTPQG